MKRGRGCEKAFTCCADAERDEHIAAAARLLQPVSDELPRIFCYRPHHQHHHHMGFIFLVNLRHPEPQLQRRTGAPPAPIDGFAENKC